MSEDKSVRERVFGHKDNEEFTTTLSTMKEIRDQLKKAKTVAYEEGVQVGFQLAKTKSKHMALLAGDPDLAAEIEKLRLGKK